MTDTYHVLRGKRRAKRPAPDIYDIPSRETVDDGSTILHAGDHSPTCADCGVGTLQWAEAGYVPWHRICDVCGSHWDLHPITWGPARARRAKAAEWGPEHEHSDTCRTWIEEGVPEHVLDEGTGSRCTCGAAARRPRDIQIGDLVRWVDGRGEVLLDRAERISADCPYTWGDLAGLCTADHWAAAERDATRMAGMVVVPGAWARRARFWRR